MPIKLSITGDIASGRDLKRLFANVRTRFKSRLAGIAAKYETRYVANTLSVKGHRTLGQVTGRLAANLNVKASNSGPLGQLAVFVGPGPQLRYGGIQDERRGWFLYGIDRNKLYLENLIAEALADAAKGAKAK